MNILGMAVFFLGVFSFAVGKISAVGCAVFVAASIGFLGYTPFLLSKKANEEISRLTVDKAFISAHGINFEVGLTAIGDQQLQMKQAILKTTDHVIVLADSGRFGGGYFSVICPISRVSKIVTDSQIGEDVIRKAALRNVSLVIA